ncbi:MAG: DUF2165 domain-containing protein [Rhodospirillaceae bacterium]|nr:DUF2165 domain-containing protein [Rhodospirillaceae bacterium]
MILRLAKAWLVLLVAAFALLVGANNILDYGSNFEFVRHVLTMDTTFPGNALKGRAVAAPWAHHAAYASIIAAELAAGLLCLAGALRLYAARRSPAASFRRAKNLAIVGLVLGFTLWFGGFLVVGGEWFMMWQSQSWNGQQGAFRFIVCIGIVLVFVATGEEGADAV